MTARKPVEPVPELVRSVYGAIHAELTKLGAVETAEGQIALNLAAVLDDRAGIQGVAATAKQLGAVLDAVRDRHKPREAGRLAVLRGGAVKAG